MLEHTEDCLLATTVVNLLSEVSIQTNLKDQAGNPVVINLTAQDFRKAVDYLEAL